VNCKVRPLLGNPRSNRRIVFSVVRAATVAMQRRYKHTSTTIEGLCFLHGPCQGVILKTTGAAQLVDKSFVRETVKKRVSCKGAAVKRRVYVRYSYSETVIVPMLKFITRKR
jgi:hypothetical protein